MAEQPRKTEFQQRFRNAGNANVMQPAGEGPGNQMATPTPGERLTGTEMRAEQGWPQQGDSRHADSNYDPARPNDAPRDALRVQHSGEAASDSDTNDEHGDQAVRARVEGLIGNPD